MLNKQLLINFFNLDQNSMYEFYPKYSQSVSIGLSYYTREVTINQHLYISRIKIHISSGNSTGRIRCTAPDGTVLKETTRNNKDTFDMSDGGFYLPQGSKIKVENLNYPDNIQITEAVGYPVIVTKFNPEGFSEIVQGGGKKCYKAYSVSLPKKAANLLLWGLVA